MEALQAQFTGWAIVELMGHQKEIGYVTTEAYGSAVLFRVDTPELPEREHVLNRPAYTGEIGLRAWTPAGAKVKRAATPARSRLVAPNALYAMNPCSEEAARAALEHMVERPLILVEMPAVAALPPGDDPDDDPNVDYEFGESPYEEISHEPK